MARASAGAFVHQPSQAAGEVAPDLWGRVDQALYYIGLRTCLNFIVRQYGGSANRPGTKFSAESKNSAKKLRVIPFQFNEEQTYCIELGDQYMRFIKQDGEVLEAPKTITAATKADPCVVTSAGHGFSNGDDVYITGIVGMVELNGRTFRVKNVAANTFELTDYEGNNINSTDYSTYTSGGTAARIYTVATPWTEDDLFDLNYAQSNDVLTILHNDYFPRDITRTAHTSWTVGLFNNTSGPFKDINITATTVQASAATGTNITVTASSAIFDPANMVGDLFYIEQMPTDSTKRWEVEVGIRDAEIRRADERYYQAPTHGISKTITGITAAAPGVVTATAHGFTNGDVIYISGVVGMLEINNKFFKVLVKTANTFSLQRLDGVDFSTSGYTAYSSGGTAEKAHMTGTVRPYHIEGSSTDGDPGIEWTYLHSGFGIVKFISDAGNSTTVMHADVINRLPASVVSGTTTLWAKQAWSVADGYPQSAAYHKRRLWMGGTTQQPNGLWASGVQARTFFGVNRPVLADDSIFIPLDTTEVNAIRHLIPLKQLIAMTSASEQLISGVDGIIDATEPPSNDVQGYTGASVVKPIIIGNTAVFVQDLGNVVRSLQYNLDSDSFTGIDLSARSPHLFEFKTVKDWGYQRHPFSVIWTVMSDGMLNGFTYMKEQEVYAWHRHETDGLWESVCCIREGNETAAYFVVKRTIGGVTKRYVERLSTRFFSTVRDSYFMDCGLSYDGRNYSEDRNGNIVALTSTTITVSGGTTWDAPEELTLTASASIFKSTDVGNRITFRVGSIAYNLDITGFTSGTVVTAVPTKLLPVTHRTTARTDWEFARVTFRPLYHIEGKTVACLADGKVIKDLVVDDGAVTLPFPAAVVHIGLPYNSDLETLDMASPPPGETKAKSLTIPRVFVTVKESRGLKIGTNRRGFDDLTTLRQRSVDIGYDAAIPAETTIFEVLTNNDWSNQGRVCIRQDEPLPLTVTCITPEVVIGYG